MKRLIVNADDLGLTNGINRGVMAAHEAGIITSATLMASGPRFPEAVALAALQSNLGIGCHVVLVDGTPVSDPVQVGSLLTSSANDGKEFRNSLSNFAQAAIRRQIKASEIEIEAASQMQKIRNQGIAISHFDTHKHTHMLPRVLEPLLQAAKQMGVTALRNPFEPEWAVGLGTFNGLGFSLGRGWLRPFELTVLRRFLPGFRRLAEKYGMRYPDGTIGVALTGSLGEESLTGLLRVIPEGTWELVCHPGHNDDELRATRTRLRESREMELALLRSDAAKEIIRARGIELINFREL